MDLRYTEVLKWLLFFLAILVAILVFVSWVLGVPIPGLSGPDQPQSPFSP